MKRTILHTLILLLSLSSCNKEKEIETIYYVKEKPSDKNAPEKVNDKKNVDDSGKSSESDTLNTSANSSLNIICDDNNCPEGIGYLTYDNKICQSMLISENEVIASSRCLDEKYNLEKICESLIYHGDNKSYKCTSVKKTNQGFFSITLKESIENNLIKINKSEFESHDLDTYNYSLENNSVIQNSKKCDLEFNSVNHLDANGVDSKILYALDCDEDFLFSDQELVGVRVGRDKFGTRFFNLRCLLEKCLDKVSKKDKVKKAFFQTERGKMLKPVLSQELELSLLTHTSVFYGIESNNLVLYRNIKCFSIVERERYEQATYLIPFEIAENGIPIVKSNEIGRGKTIYYYINFFYEDNPIVNIPNKHILRNKPNRVNNSYDIVKNNEYEDYFEIRNLIGKYNVYETKEDKTDYSKFVNDINNQNLSSYKKSIVPRCSAL